VARGSAIVQVEDTRYTAEPGAAVVLPRYTAYSVLPTGGEELLAVLTYTPAFHGKDVVVVE
jgi:mannose-6-phosphate isomerase-like protein (cupin superfamily)